MSEQKKSVTTQDTPVTQGDEFAARRRVIKGLVGAVPVIMTAASGAAMANNSNLQCLAKLSSEAPAHCLEGAEASPPATDNWMRVLESKDGVGDLNGDNDEFDSCLVYVSPDGLSTSLDPNGGYSPVTNSCYNSFM